MASKILLSLLLIFMAANAEKAALRKRSLQLTTFECILVEVASDDADHSSQYEHACQARGDSGNFDMMYSIDDNNDKINVLLGENGLDAAHNSGRYKITMTNVIVDLNPVVTTTPATEVTIEDLGPPDGTPAETSTFSCVLVEVATEFEDKSSIFEHTCIGDNDLIFKIDDNYEKIVHMLGSKGLDIARNSGRYKVTMTNLVLNLDEFFVVTTPDTEVEIDDIGNELETAGRKRELAKSSGVSTIAIIQVEASDKGLSYDKARVADAFFGINGDVNNMADRYEACSMGALIFRPASGTSPELENGVGSVSVGSIVGKNVHTLVNEITQAVTAKYGSSLRTKFDNVVYNVPRGTTFGEGGSNGWLAFAYMNSYLAVYNDENVMYISNQVHETGHNLGLMHSEHDGVDYGDQSGTMGYGYGQFDFPQMCFNAAKSWQLGWYSARSSDLKPNQSTWTGNLDAFVDYKSIPENEKAVLRVGNYHMIYNRKKGINSETQEFADKITITQTPSIINYSEGLSYHKAALSSGGMYSFPYNGQTAVFQVCSTFVESGIDKAKVSVYMSGSASGCNGPVTSGIATPPPTPQPVVQPTRPPTPPPTPPPVPNPTRPPTPSPTSPPTTPPVPNPTPPPTPYPTPFPTRPPTPQPTVLPTPGPTKPPTLPPTPTPTTRPPTPGPTEAPTTAAPTHPVCANDEMDVRITINTDNNPQQTSWYFKRRRGFPVGSGGPYTEANSAFFYRYCVLADQTYEFRLLDSGNNGIQRNGDAYTITVNGELFSSSDGSFDAEEVDYVTGPCAADMELMQFILHTGTRPEDVSWTLTGNSIGGNFASGGPWSKHKGISMGYITHMCLNPTICYLLTVKSQNGLDNGSIELNWAQQNAKTSAFSSGNAEAITFGKC